ncbi:hypothetical protein [Prosthecomicrobium pneumaticum]|uniref:Uncharacterized protein n=1 Tax=Prosthecomicrobium pneumaticum TaxID=81895 RepID=A0A7W9FQ20_9HYPH|nr:hypothetical protein [Prosthecomicrobium pneumaticum]MBB5754767.1 hypothetical protein [Prosthecomicrobium pneumaticum]
MVRSLSALSDWFRKLAEAVGEVFAPQPALQPIPVRVRERRPVRD